MSPRFGFLQIGLSMITLVVGTLLIVLVVLSVAHYQVWEDQDRLRDNYDQLFEVNFNTCNDRNLLVKERDSFAKKLKDATETAVHNKEVADKLRIELDAIKHQRSFDGETIDDMVKQLQGFQDREALCDLALEKARFELTELREFVNAIRTRAITLAKQAA